MKGAEAYVNDQWNTCGLAELPEGAESQRISLHFIVPRDAQFTALLTHISAVAQQRLREAYPGRAVHAEPVAGSVVGDGTGDGITLVFHVAAQVDQATESTPPVQR
jgi:hypothetical protein